jgi:hypothetical protein
MENTTDAASPLDIPVSRFGNTLVGQDFRFTDDGPMFRRTQGAWAQRVACIGGHKSIYGGSMIPVSRTETVLPAN